MIILKNNTTRTILGVALLALPLLYLPDLQGLARFWRLMILTVIVLLAVVITSFQKNIAKCRLSRPIQLLLAVIALAMIITWVANVRSSRSVAYIGREPEYLGYLAWAVIVAAGLVFCRDVKRILSAPGMLAVGVTVGLSCLFGIFNIRHGLKLGGALYQPLSMAMYANLAIIVCLYQLQAARRVSIRWLSLAVLILSAATVLFAQSKLGVIMAIVNLLVWTFYAIDSSRLTRSFLAALAVLTVALLVLAPTYFAGLRHEQVGPSLVYTGRLYKSTFENMSPHRLLYGGGAASLPPTVNNQNFVPADITKSLGTPTRFSANHNLFFDFYYFFGGLAALALVALNVLAFRAYAIRRTRFGLAPLLLLVTLLVNAVFNAPSLELTSLYFAVLFSFLLPITAKVGNHELD